VQYRQYNFNTYSCREIRSIQHLIFTQETSVIDRFKDEVITNDTIRKTHRKSIMHDIILHRYFRRDARFSFSSSKTDVLERTTYSIAIMRVTNYEKCAVNLFFAMVTDRSEVENTCHVHVPRVSVSRHISIQYYIVIILYFTPCTYADKSLAFCSSGMLMPSDLN